MNNVRLRLFSALRIVSANTAISSSQVHTSRCLLKVHKTEKKKPAQIIHTEKTTDNPYIKGAIKDMEDLENILADELVKHFSLQVDLRTYEDIIVKLEKGDEHKMSMLGRVILKTPQLVMINFADNPTAIKAAKLALEKSALAVHPQQEGVVLYIPTPKMTRERREQLAKEAGGKILNDYKKAINDVFCQYDRKCSQECTDQDIARTTRKELLELKRAMDARANKLIDNKKKHLLKEQESDVQ